MIRLIRLIAATIWLPAPPFLLSALIHMADPDIGGWRGLASVSALWSVAVFGILACPVFVLCFGVLMDWGRLAFLVVGGLSSFCVGLFLTVVGSGATTIAGRAWTLVGCTGVVFVFVLASVIPAAALGCPRALRSSPKYS